MRNNLLLRYVFKGELTMLSAMHIGGGKMQFSSTDSPVVRTATGEPFIPGSSFKGVFRSTVEKIAAVLPGLETCQLFDEDSCCPSVHQKDYNDKRKNKSEEEFYNLLDENICSGCSLFGSPYTSGKLYFQDLYPSKWSGVVAVRDGVAIDRDSERAVDKMKYDYEVVEAGTSFCLELHLENPRKTDLAMTCLGIQELTNGFFYIGGMRSRGLGRCRLDNLMIYKLDFHSGSEEERLEKLGTYLRGNSIEEKMSPIDNPNAFLEEQMNFLLKSSANGINDNSNTSQEGGIENA